MARGLRERRKEEMRRELSQAAIALFLKQGFENTTVDQIVEPLGIARRTFFRHFATKEDLVFVWYEDLKDELVSACSARPQDEGPYESVCAALRGLLRYYDENPAWGKAMLALAGETPALSAKSFEKRAMWQNALAEVLVPRMDDHPRRALSARIIACTAINAFALAVNAWFEEGGTGDLHATVEAAFACGGGPAALERRGG